MNKIIIVYTLLCILIVFNHTLYGQNCENNEDSLKVALVGGSESPAYQANYAMVVLKDYLEANYPIETVLMPFYIWENTFENIDSLEIVDTAVLFVRRKTLEEEDLDLFRDFFNSGKGFVAIRPTSHAWENWPDFDREVLGANYQGTFHVGDKRNPSMEEITMSEHPIFEGARDFSTDLYMYDYEDIANDVNVVMQGRVGEYTTPMAWTRMYKGGRVFRLVPGSLELFHDADYLRIVGNGIMWVAGCQIPDAH